MIGFDWFIAANYCNWLSEQEELPRDQWCYLPNLDGAYAEGMTIPLTCFAQWVPAAHGAGMGILLRSGTVTSYYWVVD